MGDALQNGVAAMAWGCAGYRLVLAEAGMAAQVLELSLAKSPRGSHRILHPSFAHDLPGLHAFSAPAYVPHRSGGEASLHLQADDRLLLVTDGNDALSPALPHPSSGLPGAGGQANSASQSADLRVIHLRLPAPYLAANWPLSHAALSSDGMDIAVAGRYGLALYSRRSAKVAPFWRRQPGEGDVRACESHSNQSLCPRATVLMTRVQLFVL